MSDRVTSWLRTVVPTAWAALITLAVDNLDWLPQPLVDWLNSEAAVALVMTATLAIWYTAWRWAEPKLPDWLTRLALGSPRQPSYPEPVPAEA